MMLRSWAVVFRDKFVAVKRIFLVLSVLLLLGQVSATAQSKKAAHSKSSARQSKLRHINKAFVASADLKPMAQQLLQNRTPQAYAGVEAYARRHQGDEAGPLAWLVLGYAHYLDNDFPKAFSELRRTFDIRALAIEGGSKLNGQLLAQNLIDELFLTLAPKIKLGECLPTYAGGEPLPRGSLQNYELVELHRVESEVFLRYRRIFN